MKHIRVPLSLLVGVCMLSGPGLVSVGAQTRQLERITVSLMGRGYQDTGRRWSGSLDQGESGGHSVYLRRGVEYVFSATCDIDCSDVDLQLFSPSGALVAEDVRSDDVPQIAFTPSVSGTYRISVRMYECSLQQCGYSLSAVQW